MGRFLVICREYYISVKSFIVFLFYLTMCKLFAIICIENSQKGGEKMREKSNFKNLLFCFYKGGGKR